jgi:LysR family transcriptional regulator, hydrogen peroxide-inducible genes activator
MELHQLRYFCAVARAGGFTRAAHRENVAQPTLSHQIHKLEKELGVPLFERLGRTVRLTKFGEDLLPRATQILRGIEDAQMSLGSLDEGIRGPIKVGVIPTIMPYFLAPRVSDFSARYPEVELRLTEDMTFKLVEGLQAGELDIVVASLPVTNPDIVCSELFREPIFLAVSQNHRLGQGETADIAEVRHERLVLLKEGHCFRDQVLAACTRSNAQLESIFESDQFSSIFPLVASGFGLSLVPAMAAASASGCRLMPLKRSVVRRIGFLRNRRDVHSKATRAFTGWLREQAKNVDSGS